MRRPVYTLIGDGGRPLHQPRIEMRPRVKAFAGERIARDVLDAGFHFAFRLRAIRGARPRPKAVVAREVGIRGMPAHRVARVLQHHRARVVDDHPIRDAAEMLEGQFMPAEPLAQALPREGHRE